MIDTAWSLSLDTMPSSTISTIAAIDLQSDQDTAIETFECTWQYQHFEASGVNF